MTSTDVPSYWIASFLFVLSRCSGFVAASPLWGDSMLPSTVKIGLTFVLSIAFCGQIGTDSVPISTLAPDSLASTMAIHMPLEFCIGSLLGLTLTLVFVPLRIAGSYLTQEIGLTLGNLTSPGIAEPPPGLGMLLYGAGVLCFLGANLHHSLIAALALSFHSIPAGNPPWQTWCSWYAQETMYAHDMGLVIVGGTLLALMALSVFLLFLAKASPMFNLFTVGTSIRLLAGMLALLMFIPDIVWAIITSMQMTLDRMLTTLGT